MHVNNACNLGMESKEGRVVIGEIKMMIMAAAMR